VLDLACPERDSGAFGKFSKILSAKFECKYHLKAKGFDFEKVVDRVAELTGREPAEVLAVGRHKKGIAARSILCSWAMRELGISQTQWVRVLRISQPAVSMAVTRGERLAKDYNFSKMNGDL